MTKTEAEHLVIEHGHSLDDVAPVKRRINLYRALASTTGNKQIAAHFFQCADDLAAGEEKVGQRRFQFAANLH